MTPMMLTATPPTTASFDDGSEHQAYEARTPETLSQRVARPDWRHESLVPLGKALDALADLQPDWDSYGALPPSRMVLHYAWSLASGLIDKGMPVPQVFPTRSGGVQFEWHCPGASLEWEIDANLNTGVFIFDDHRTGERIDGELPGELDLLARAVSRIFVA